MSDGSSLCQSHQNRGAFNPGKCFPGLWIAECTRLAQNGKDDACINNFSWVGYCSGWECFGHCHSSNNFWICWKSYRSCAQSFPRCCVLLLWLPSLRRLISVNPLFRIHNFPVQVRGKILWKATCSTSNMNRMCALILKRAYIWGRVTSCAVNIECGLYCHFQIAG